MSTSKSNVDWREAAKLAAQGWSNYKIAKQFDVWESTIRRGLDTMGVKRYLVPSDPPVSERMNLVIDTPIVLPLEGSYAITADWHIPLYDPEYVNTFIKDARARGVRSLVLAGDFFNFDALSVYEPKQKGAGLEEELAEAEDVMRILLETFDDIYFLWGNHDARLHKALGFTIQFKEAMRLTFGSLGTEALDRITFTNLDHLWIGDAISDDRWYICHPGNYTRVPLSNARTLATKYNASVITAHSHHCAVGYGIDGSRVVAEIGGLFDRHKTAYLQRSTTFPTWSQGYAFLTGGKLTVRSPGWDV